MTSDEERELLDRFRQGDQAAMEELIQMATKTINCRANHLIKQYCIRAPHLTKSDFIQEAWLSAIRGAKCFTAESLAQWFAWLMRILVTEFLCGIKFVTAAKRARKQLQGEFDFVAKNSTTSGEAIFNEGMSLYLKFYSEETPEDQLLFATRLGGATIRELAIEFQCSANKISKRLNTIEDTILRKLALAGYQIDPV